MPFVEIADQRNSDVVLYEADNRASRDVVSITNAAGGTYKQGAIVWRVKGTNPDAQWDFVDNASELALANEYGILLGTKEAGKPFAPKEVNVVAAATATPAIVITRLAGVKEQILEEFIDVTQGLTEANWLTLKHLLKFQNILVHDAAELVV